MQNAHFFGYGSLVHTGTHAYRDHHTARLQGWGRIWRHVPAHSAAVLSVERRHGCAIDGLIARVPDGDWAALDLREGNYTRHLVTDAVSEHPVGDAEIQVYSVPLANCGDGSAQILQSYLDVVVKGYLDMFGETGAEAFFDSTHGWHMPVRNDRAQPAYPRHQQLSTAERTLVDRLLTRAQAKA